MHLAEAIDHLLAGDALLFLGAGFSQGGVNLTGEPIPGGAAFTERLVTLAKVRAQNPDLHQAARAYVKVLGPDALVKLVKETFTVKAITATHRSIVSQKWRRLYTTNYDNVVEVSAAETKRAVTTVTAGAKAEDYGSKPNLCIHINGYAPSVTIDKLDTELKLTNTSYLTETFADSTWAHLFKSDVRAAKAVIFIGYSLHDLDIQRLLHADLSSKSRCVFVVRREADDLEKGTLSDFGEVFPIGVDAFVVQVNTRAAGFVPKPVAFSFVSIERLRAPSGTSAPADNDVIDLLLQGNAKDDFVWHSFVTRDSTSYYLSRTALTPIVESLTDAKRDVVLHSDFANGKTLLARGVALECLAKGYDSYFVTNPGRTLTRELQEVAGSATPAVVLFENYPRFESEIRQFVLQANANVRILYTARSGEHDLDVEWLQKLSAKRDLLEFDINQLDDKEITLSVEFLERFGLWGRHARKSRGERFRLVKSGYDAEFQKLLLDVLHAPQVVSRLQQLLQGVVEDADLRSAVIALSALNVLNYFPRISLVCDLIDAPTIRRISFTRHPALTRMTEVNGDIASIRSSVLSRHLLVDVFSGEHVIDVLIRMARRSESLRRIDPLMGQLFRDLQKFSNIQWLLPEQNRRPLLIKYYETLKDFSSSRGNPFFWLQYAIARLSFQDYPNAGRHFENAYSLAAAIPGFDTFQIDNHYARFLLENAIARGDPVSGFDAFSEARAIVNRHLGSDHLHYPYRVARLYEDFYKTFESTFTDDQKAQIFDASKTVINRIQELKGPLRENRYVLDAKQRLTILLKRQPAGG